MSLYSNLYIDNNIMFIINILWTIDLMDEDKDKETMLSPKMFACTMANDMVRSDTNISLVCSSETATAILSASLLSKEISEQKGEKLDNNCTYVLPYINCPYNNYRPAHHIHLPNLKILKQDDNYPLFYRYFSSFRMFDLYIIPIIKNLLWVKYNLGKTILKKNNNYEYNVIVVTHSTFIEKTFGIGIKKGEFIRQTYCYENFDDKKPKDIYYNLPNLHSNKWYKNIISPKREVYRKIFLHFI